VFNSLQKSLYFLNLLYLNFFRADPKTLIAFYNIVSQIINRASDLFVNSKKL